jgi:neutral ceramidase
MNSDNHNTLYAGAARVDITPSGNCLMGGFAARDHGCEGIHDRLYVTALALSRHGKKLVIIGVDILALNNEQMDKIWMFADKRLNLRPDQLFINCSHTHAGPEVRPTFNHETCAPGQVGKPDPAYIDELLEKIIISADKALKSLKPAEAAWGIGETFIGINRRAPDKSIYSQQATGYENFPNPDKEIDRTCPVILIKDKKGKPISLVSGASCHPTTMRYDNYLISAEFPGVTRRILEEDLEGAPSLFLQGIAGDVKPRQVVAGNSFRSGNFDDIEIVGQELAADVIRTIKKGLKPLDVRIGTSLKRVALPFNKSWNRETFRRYASKEEAQYRRVWAEYWLKKLSQGEAVPQSIDLTLSIVELSPELRLLGIAGELLTDMGLKIKHQFKDGNTLPFGYTNGEIAYIPDAEALREGGYEAIETIFFSHDKPAPFIEEIEEIILTGFDELKRDIVYTR